MIGKHVSVAFSHGVGEELRGSQTADSITQLARLTVQK